MPVYIAHHPIYVYQVPEGHKFPMRKYELLIEQLLYEGTITAGQVFEPQPLAEADILLTHTPEYWQRLRGLHLTTPEVRAIGLPMSARLVDRSQHIMQGTWQAAQYALRHGVGLNSAGGTHHAFSYQGRGFCLLNDNAIAANLLLQHGQATKILIVDLDVHQGDGTAEIFANEPRVFTFSMHGERNYPFRKEKSDLDIGLPDGTTDAEYLAMLGDTLPRLIEEQQPDFMFFNSGVDVLATDKLGYLSLTSRGCLERDRLVLGTAKAHGIPIAVSMGGGYSDDIRHIVDAHANTFRVAMDLFD